MTDQMPPSRTTLLEPATEPPNFRYTPIPHRGEIPGGKKRPVWRVRFDVASANKQQFGLDINDEIVFGRGKDAVNLVDLTPYDADDLGVSRRHVMLRPSQTNLYVIDLGSKNSTLRNGQSIGVNTPYPLTNGDTLMMGKFQVTVNIVNRPKLDTDVGARRMDFTDAVAQLAKSITSNLKIDEVFGHITETSMKLTSAGEAGIWLKDEQTGEIFLEAKRGIEEQDIQRRRLPPEHDSPVLKTFRTGEVVREHREPGQEKIKIETGYLVYALLVLPISLGGVTFGALMVVHRSPGQQFTPEDERLLKAIAEFAAIAIQNARLYQATDEALERRVKELAALNQLTGAVSSSLDLDLVHEVATSQIKVHWDVEDVILWLADEASDTMYPYKVDENTLTRIVHGAAGQVEAIIQEVRTTAQPKAADFLSQEDQNSAAGIKATIKIQARSIACIPLIIQGQVRSVLSLFRKKSGMFSADDLDHLQAFANPIATAIENARLFAASEQQRETIRATSYALLQPLLILDENGQVIISNQPAEEIITNHMAELFNGISESIGHTTELKIGERTYLTTSEHSSEVGTIVVMQDITYVKQLEKERTELVHTLTHNLKSPITSVKGWAQLTQRVAQLDEKSAQFVQQIVDSADRMVSMINGLLHSISEEESINLMTQSCHLDEIVERAMRELSGAALAKSLQVSFESSNVPFKVQADETRLYHMALNLISNAIKYSTDNGQIDIALDATSDGVVLRVRDSGIGIPDDDMPHIFEKGYRADNAAEMHTGAGVGLTHVRAIVQAHGGTVEAAKIPEGGTEFVVKLPSTLRLS